MLLGQDNKNPSQDNDLLNVILYSLNGNFSSPLMLSVTTNDTPHVHSALLNGNNR